jgi:hypothetical protein
MRFARLAALAVLVLSLVAALLAEAQQAEKVYRIGLLRGDGPQHAVSVTASRPVWLASARSEDQRRGCADLR